MKFRRAALALVLPEGDQVAVHITGRIGAGQSFTADDTLDVRQGHVVQPHPHEVVPVGLPYNVQYDASTGERTMPVALLVWFGHGGTWTIQSTGLANTGSIAWAVPPQPADSVRIAVAQMAKGQPAQLENMIGVLGISDYFSIQGTLAVSNLPAATQLTQITPNPSSGPTLFRFSLTRASVASLEVFDLQGRQVRALELGHRGPGWHEVTWDGRDRSGAQVGAGLYFVRLRTTFGEWTQRMVRMAR